MLTFLLEPRNEIAFGYRVRITCAFAGCRNLFIFIFYNNAVGVHFDIVANDRRWQAFRWLNPGCYAHIRRWGGGSPGI